MRPFRSRFLLAAATASAAAACAPVSPRTGPAPETSIQAARVRARALTGADARPLQVIYPDSLGMVRVTVFTNYAPYRDSLARAARRITLPTLWVTLSGEVRDSCAHFTRGREAAETVRLLGLLPGDDRGRFFVEMEVPATSLFRPAPNPDPTRAIPCAAASAAGACDAPSSVDPEQAAVLERARGTAYPFTGLGYTYNWRAGAPPYGATELIVRAGTVARLIDAQEPIPYCRAS
jgi:hypothetical protein